MAGQDRTAAHALELGRALQEKPYEFGFFQAVRLLECAHPDKPRIGQSLRPGDDPVRLAQEPSLTFAPSTLSAFEPGKNGLPPRLVERFFGLLGPNGPLPLHLTEYARDRLRNARDPTFARFLDIFHHRMLTLFYRAWANAEPTVNFDRPETDRFALYVGALFGLGMPSLRHRDGMPDLAKLYFAGRFACQSRPAEGLQAILEGFFDAPVRIEQFVGGWMEVPEEARCRLGESPDTGTLGETLVIGERVWGGQQKFRIVFGPMSLADYLRLIPSGDSLDLLVPIVRNYVGDELTWDVRLILRKDEVPELKLGARQLGWTTWLLSRPAQEDAGDALLNPLAAPS